jgi:hypothetical protein
LSLSFHTDMILVSHIMIHHYPLPYDSQNQGNG